jgi:hypothetical protein
MSTKTKKKRKKNESSQMAPRVHQAIAHMLALSTM